MAGAAAAGASDVPAAPAAPAGPYARPDPDRIRITGTTMRMVAGYADVSLQTVSRVINGAPNVRPEMRARVERAIDALGYVPSLAAQRMSGSRSYLIMAINDRARTIADWRAREGNDWVDQMLLGGMLACAQHGYRLVLELIDPVTGRDASAIGAAINAVQPDGVILTPPHADHPAILAWLGRRAIPYVRLGTGRLEALDPEGQGVVHDPSRDGLVVAMDDAGAARLATEHLLALGHRRIGFIAGPDSYAISAQRVAGWRAALTAAGLDPGPASALLAVGDFTHASGAAATRGYLALPAGDAPTAIIASNDQMAHGALSVLNDAGRRVPDDVSLISFDNSPSTRFSSPALTAIDQPVAAITARAVDLLIAAHCHDEWPDGPAILPATLVMRQSVGPAPAGAVDGAMNGTMDPGP